MIENILHRKATCFLFTPLFFILAWVVWVFILPSNQSIQNNGFMFILGFFSIVLWVVFIGAGIAHFISLFAGADCSLIDFSKPHRAVLSKDSSGQYFVSVCRFPFWTDVAGILDTEESAINEYEKLKKDSEAARQKKLESGPIRVLAEPTKKSAAKTDAFEHIAGILNQYAPDKVDAIRKLKEVFDK